MNTISDVIWKPEFLWTSLLHTLDVTLWQGCAKGGPKAKSLAH